MVFLNITSGGCIYLPLVVQEKRLLSNYTHPQVMVPLQGLPEIMLLFGDMLSLVTIIKKLSLHK